MNDKFSAIVPLRAGSKRIKNKNTILLDGKPLFTYTLDAALKSKYIIEIIISTNDWNVIKIIGDNYQDLLGNKIKVIDRDEQYSNDESSTIDLITEDIFGRLETNGNIILLQVTSPLRNHIDIDNAIEEYQRSGMDSLVSVKKSKEIPYWQYKISNQGLVPIMGKKFQNIRSQDLPDSYVLNGAIYITSKENLLKNKSFFSDSTIGFIMSSYGSVDIDEYEDLKYCNFLLNENR